MVPQLINGGRYSKWRSFSNRKPLQYLYSQWPRFLRLIYVQGLTVWQTEQDIAEIAGAGLNWIRLPIPFWAIETWPGEPFLAKTSWKYVHVLRWVM